MKNTYLNVRISESEKYMLDELLKNSPKNKSDFIRSLILKEFIEQNSKQNK